MENQAGQSARPEVDQSIVQSINLLLHSVREQDSRRMERRKVQRGPYPYPVYLTPLSPDREPLLEETVVALGKSVSELGLEFYHGSALPYRRMIASLEYEEGRWLAFEMDLSWCRFGKHGYYENGGRFLRLVDSPLGGASETVMIA